MINSNTFPLVSGQPALLGRRVGGGGRSAEDVPEQPRAAPGSARSARRRLGTA